MTGKFPLVGFGWSAPAAEGLGAGTPASEVRLLLGLGLSHDEAEEPEGPGRVLATGGGRFENVAAAFRWGVSPRVSLEGFFVLHRHRITDLVNAGPSLFRYTEERLLIAERGEGALGVRWRAKDLEVALEARIEDVQGKANTARAALLGQGTLPGAAAEVRWRPGRWHAAAGAAFADGSVRRDDQYAPAFAVASARPRAFFREAGISLGGAFGAVEVFLGLFREENGLPWVSLAMLGEELRLLDSGFRPVSESRTTGGDLLVRVRLARGVILKLFGRGAVTHEEVTFTDALAGRPAERVDVKIPFGQQYAFGLGLDFALGGGS